MFRHVIVGVDGGAAGRDAIAVARLLTAADGRIELAYVHELTPVRGASGAYGPAETAEAMRLLEGEREATGVDAELIAITASSAGRGLHYLAQTRGADLLTVGSNPRSMGGRVLMGDVTRAALIGAPCAVAVAPLGYAGAGRTIAKIGVGYDGSPESDAALAFARELAEHNGAQLRAMMVVEYSTLLHSQADPDELEAAERELAQRQLDGEVGSGDPGEELAAFSAGVDLLVVGSRGYGPIRTLMLGGTAVYLASNARCPLLVLPRLAEDG